MTNDTDDTPLELLWEQTCWKRWLASDFDDGTLERSWLHAIDQAIQEGLVAEDVDLSDLAVGKGTTHVS